MTSRTRYGALSVAAGIAAVVALLLAAALLVGGDEGDAPTGDLPRETPSSPASDPDVCRLKVTDAVLTLDRAFLAALDQRGVRVEAIAPASAAGAGRIHLRRRVSVDVSCDLTTGVIGLRGGVRLRGRDSVLDLRRLRITPADSRVAAYFRARSPAPVDAMRIDLEAAARSREGSAEIVVAPLVLAGAGRGAIDYAFGTSPRRDAAALGTLTLTSERIEQD
jgi:hypothetical protein